MTSTMLGSVCVMFLCVFLCFDFVRGGRMVINFPTINCKPPTKCIEIRKCAYFDDLLNRSAKPRPHNVIKQIRENQCGLYRNIPYVCCESPTPPPPPTLAPSDPPRMTEPSTLGVIPQIVNRLNSLTGHPNYRYLKNDICGIINTNNRITGGKKTLLNEFPWMALIAYYQDATVDFRCGGTIINELYVLTAAHCIINSTIVGVRLGEHNLNTVQDCDPDAGYCAPPVQDFSIENIILHSDYDSKTLINDIALIKLATPANFSNANVQPICLPIEDMDLSGKFTIVTGWGVTEDGFKSSELLKTSIPVLDISECRSIYHNFSHIADSQICAGGYAGRDSCAGDSGGPMNYVGMIDGKPRFVQYGIVSYGPRHCGTDGRPGVYTRVSKYVDWILDNLEPGREKMKTATD